jgi:hypothetical protein
VAKSSRPAALQGVAIPSRHRTVRRRVVAMFDACPWLQPEQVRLVVEYCEIGLTTDRIKRRLLPKKGQPDPMFKVDGDPKDLLDALRKWYELSLKYADRLGLTPPSKASLGLDIARGRSLAELMSRPSSQLDGEA